MTLEEYIEQALETRQKWLKGKLSHKEYVNLANAHVIELAVALREMKSDQDQMKTALRKIEHDSFIMAPIVGEGGKTVKELGRIARECLNNTKRKEKEE